MARAVRPRYARIGALAVAVSVTGTAVLGAALLPAGPAPSYAEETATEPARRADRASVELVAEDPETVRPGGRAPLPPASGAGRRVVFDISEQRVWLVRSGGSVKRSYLVSGSVHDNLRPGSYEVYSRSRHATGIDGSTMERMVRFTHGKNAAIGFHDIPVMRGRLVQTTAELGTPLSHGCIRQAEADSLALWRFAPVGTTVVVTA